MLQLNENQEVTVTVDKEKQEQKAREQALREASKINTKKKEGQESEVQKKEE